MSSVLNVIITNAGIAEVINAQHTGTAPVVLAQVGFGQGIYTPTADQTAMQDEIKRVSTIAGGVVGSNIMHIQALDSGEAAYAVYEIGVYTASGTLFAIYSQSTPILNKVSDSSIMCVIDFVLSGVEPTSVTVGDTDYTLAPATTTNQGVVELATDDEVIAGTDTARAVTPAGGAAAYVALSGNQTIDGKKTFTGGLESPTFTGDLTGKIPQPTYGPDSTGLSTKTRVASGCIFMGWVRASVGQPLSVHAGQSIGSDLGDSSSKVYPALYENGDWTIATGSNTILLGDFCALSNLNLAAGGSGLALLMKL